MKQKMLLFIFIGYSSMVSESSAQQLDNLELFRNMTDIERQLYESSQSFHGRQDNQSVGNEIRWDAVATPPDTIRPAGLNPLDSLYARSSHKTLIVPSGYDRESLRGLTFRDTLFYNPLFLPVVFNGRNFLGDTLGFLYPKSDSSRYRGMLIPPAQTFAPQLRRQAFANAVMDEYLKNHPGRVSMSAYNFAKMPQAASDREIVKGFNPFKELLSPETEFSLEVPTIEGVSIGRKYWIYSGDHKLQFSQNYFSNNWYKGGTSNLNVYNYHILSANYKRDKIRFNNTFEWKLSMNNAPDDSLRSYRIGEDLIRYYGDFGISAFVKNWSYSFNLEVKSQLFYGYAANSQEKLSAFLAPLYVNTGIGFTYDLDKKSTTVRHRRTRVTATLAPLSVNFKYVGNKEVNVTRYGIPAGLSSVTDLGSTVTATLTYDYNRFVTWNSRLKYFTSYKKVEGEFENTLNMALSRFFSTRLYLNLRYDDSVPSDSKFGYLQVNELVSFGLNYKW